MSATEWVCKQFAYARSAHAPQQTCTHSLSRTYLPFLHTVNATKYDQTAHTTRRLTYHTYRPDSVNRYVLGVMYAKSSRPTVQKKKYTRKLYSNIIDGHRRDASHVSVLLSVQIEYNFVNKSCPWNIDRFDSPHPSYCQTNAHKRRERNKNYIQINWWCDNPSQKLPVNDVHCALRAKWTLLFNFDCWMFIVWNITIIFWLCNQVCLRERERVQVCVCLCGCAKMRSS